MCWYSSIRLVNKWAAFGLWKHIPSYFRADIVLRCIWGNLFNFYPLSANPTKPSNTLKQFIGNLPTNCLSVFGHFMGLVLKGLMEPSESSPSFFSNIKRIWANLLMSVPLEIIKTIGFSDDFRENRNYFAQFHSVSLNIKIKIWRRPLLVFRCFIE